MLRFVFIGSDTPKLASAWPAGGRSLLAGDVWRTLTDDVSHRLQAGSSLGSNAQGRITFIFAALLAPALFAQPAPAKKTPAQKTAIAPALLAGTRLRALEAADTGGFVIAPAASAPAIATDAPLPPSP
jgi:hypothetical protein